MEVHIPKLNELAYENYSLVLRGYVRTWLAQIGAEYDRVRLVDRLGGNAAAA